MTDSKRNPELELRKFWVGIADSVVEISDEELLAEIQEEGDDPTAVAKDVSQLLRNAVKEYRQRALYLAKERYLATRETLSTQGYELPTEIDAKRELLAGLLSRRPELGALTAQWRDLKSVPDSDLDGILQQLAALGVLDETPPTK